jgi:hypothetical protein
VDVALVFSMLWLQEQGASTRSIGMFKFIRNIVTWLLVICLSKVAKVASMISEDF